MSHLPQALSLPLAALALALGASPLAGQGIVVDPVNGPYKTISAALAVAKDTDVIRVKKGVYAENLTLNGRAANVISIAASSTDVVLRATTPWSTALTIRNHPAGSTSRFARMVIDNGSPSTQGTDAVSTDQSAGHIVFEECQSTSRWSFRNHRGTVSLTRCVIRPLHWGDYVLLLDGIDLAFLHQCRLEPLYTNSAWVISTIFPGTVINQSTVELCRCNLRGTHWSSLTVHYVGGGPALNLTDSTCRISGLGTDAIVGGDGLVNCMSARCRQGGSGIVALRSTVTISSVRVAAGAGVDIWFNKPAPAISNTSSTIIRPTTMLPVVQNTNGFTRDQIETITLFGPPQATSLTCIALQFSPVPTPFGHLVLDLSGPVLRFPATLNAAGQATHTLDLRGLPSTFAGAPYLMQSATLAPNNVFGLSSPQNGVIATR